MADCDYYDDNGYYYHCYSAWYYWGRWVVLGLVILGALLAFLIFSFVVARDVQRLLDIYRLIITQLHDCAKTPQSWCETLCWDRMDASIRTSGVQRGAAV